jgi:hypothetical protein
MYTRSKLADFLHGTPSAGNTHAAKKHHGSAGRQHGHSGRSMAMPRGVCFLPTGIIFSAWCCGLGIPAWLEPTVSIHWWRKLRLESQIFHIKQLFYILMKQTCSSSWYCSWHVTCDLKSEFWSKMTDFSSFKIVLVGVACGIQHDLEPLPLYLLG